jgi:hypothetical protein
MIACLLAPENRNWDCRHGSISLQSSFSLFGYSTTLPINRLLTAEHALRKPVPVSLCPPQIPHDLTRVAAVGIRRLTAWATARLPTASYEAHYFYSLLITWDIILQVGRSQVRVPMRSLIFQFTESFQPHYGLGSTQPLTEMSIRKLLRGKGRPACA